MTGKTIAKAVGVVTLLGFAWGVSQFYQTDLEATTAHSQLAEYTETSQLENALELTILEIGHLLDTIERDAREENRLQYLNAKRLNIEARLLNLQGA